jgi:hypothetical protein
MVTAAKQAAAVEAESEAAAAAAAASAAASHGWSSSSDCTAFVTPTIVDVGTWPKCYIFHAWERTCTHPRLRAESVDDVHAHLVSQMVRSGFRVKLR